MKSIVAIVLCLTLLPTTVIAANSDAFEKISLRNKVSMCICRGTITYTLISKE